MQRIELQILRSALAELNGDIAAHATHPLALGKIQMTSFLLAHLLARQGAAQHYGSVEEEFSALRQAELDEQQILSVHSEPQTAVSDITVEGMTSYLQARLGDSSIRVIDLQALLGGYSKQTCILTLSGAGQFDNKLVLRRDLRGGPVESQAADEFPIIQLMHRSGVPVPAPLWADRTPPFDGTCLVMRSVPGKTAYDITGAKLGSDCKDAALALARVLGKIHRTPVSALNLPADLASATLGEHVRRMLKHYEEQWQRRRVSVSPTLLAAFAWLHANVPEGAPPSLVHGDASLRNLLVHAGTETAMLDWELWHVGDYNEDLAYCRNDVLQSVPWEEFMAEYRTHGGRGFDARAGTYYAIFGAVRNSVFSDSCLHSFTHAPIPDPKLAYGALAMGRKLIRGIAEQLNMSR